MHQQHFKSLPVEATGVQSATPGFRPRILCLVHSAELQAAFNDAAHRTHPRRSSSAKGRPRAGASTMGKILFSKNTGRLLCERDSLECVCRRADVRDTRVALNHRFLDYRVTRGKAEKDVETREEDERVPELGAVAQWEGEKEYTRAEKQREKEKAREGLSRVDLAESVADESTL